MPGIRIYHQNTSYRNCTITIEHPGKKFRFPQNCPTCMIPHHYKTYHLNLDDQAATIVSEEVFRNLKDLGLPNLAVESEVPNPPGSVLNMNGPVPRIIQEKPRIRIDRVGV